MNHTPEPWIAMPTPPASFSDHGWRALAKCGGLFMVAAPSKVVLRYENNILVDKKWDHEANARRIVACVNACAGIPDELLQDDDKNIINRYTQHLRSETIRQADLLAAVTAQRDELLKALKATFGADYEHAYNLAMDAIEKCEVQNNA